MNSVVQTREKNERTQTQTLSQKNEFTHAQTHNFQNKSTRFTLICKNERNSLQNSFFLSFFLKKKKTKTTIVILYKIFPEILKQHELE